MDAGSGRARPFRAHPCRLATRAEQTCSTTPSAMALCHRKPRAKGQLTMD